MEYDNPAARLLALLQKCKQQSPGTSCKLAWEAVLEVRGNEPLLMSRLGKAMELPQTAIDALKESFPNRQENWKHWRAQVSAGFLNQSWSCPYRYRISKFLKNNRLGLEITFNVRDYGRRYYGRRWDTTIDVNHSALGELRR
jgi:hypothetical protein